MVELKLKPSQLQKLFEFLSEHKTNFDMRLEHAFIRVNNCQIVPSNSSVTIKDKDTYITLDYLRLDAYLGDGDDNFVDFISDDFTAEIEINDNDVDVYTFLYNL